MFHACLVSTLLCFVYTLRYFYTFSGTNLLTRCRSASCLFLLFLVSEKLVRKYSRNCRGQKPKSIFYRREHRVRRAAEGWPLGVHTLGSRGSTLGCVALWCGPPGRPPT